MQSLTYQQFEESIKKERYFDENQLNLIKKYKHAEQLDTRMRQTFGYIFRSNRIKERMKESINAPEKINYINYLTKMETVLLQGTLIFYLLKNTRDIEFADFRVEQSRFFQLILKNHLFTLEELSACGPNVRKLENQLNKDDAISQLTEENIGSYALKLRQDGQKYFKYLNYLNNEIEKEVGSEKYHLKLAIFCIKKYYIQQKLASVFQQHITVDEVKQIIDERRKFEQLQLQQINKNQGAYRIFSGQKAELDENSEYQQYKILLDPKNVNIVRGLADSYFKQQFDQTLFTYYQYIQKELPYEVEFYFLTTIDEVRKSLQAEDKRLSNEIDDFKIFRKKLLQQQKFDQQQQFSIIQKDFHYEMYAMIKRGRFAFLLDDDEMQQKYYQSLFGVDKEYFNYLKGLRNINFNNSLAIYYLIHRNHYQEQQGHFSQANPMEVYDLSFEEFKYLLINCHHFDERQLDQITMKDFVEKVYNLVLEDEKMHESFKKIMNADIYAEDTETFNDFLVNHLMAVMKDLDLTDMIQDIHNYIEFITYLEDHPELNFQHSMVVFFIHSLKDLQDMTATMNVSQLIQTHGLAKTLGVEVAPPDPNATEGLD